MVQSIICVAFWFAGVVGGKDEHDGKAGACDVFGGAAGGKVCAICVWTMEFPVLSACASNVTEKASFGGCTGSGTVREPLGSTTVPIASGNASGIAEFGEKLSLLFVTCKSLEKDSLSA